MIKKGMGKTLKSVIALSLAFSMVVGSGFSVEAANKKTATTTYYTSELTGLPISTALKNQRPIAVMVDNEKVALQHFGTSEADIVYEMINSTANKRITRLMCIYKDYANIPAIGSIRSVRPTNIILSGEYNAVVVHDGGPYYINDWIAKSWSDHLSAGFARINNGKKREFTEYVTKGEVTKRLAAAKISPNYTKEFLTTIKERDTHFLFNQTETLLSQVYGAGVIPCKTIDLSNVFLHNSSKLLYNAATNTYDYYDYGMLHTDGEDAQPLTFKNVILQNVKMNELDNHGYMIYNVIGYEQVGACSGYYITDTQAIPIFWIKNGDTAFTKYYDLAGNEIKLNPGKTYIGLIPTDTCQNVVLK